MLTAAGSGYSRWRDIAVTRWREDATRDHWGSYIFLRDAQSGEVWSAGYQPSGIEPDAYEATFYEDRAEFIRRDGALTTTLEVVVSPEDDAEVRRVSITNSGARMREIQVTSYAELCLVSQAADLAHPAFSNLFVQTDFLPDAVALLATRRRQSDKETAVWAAHVVVVDGEIVGTVSVVLKSESLYVRGMAVLPWNYFQKRIYYPSRFNTKLLSAIPSISPRGLRNRKFDKRPIMDAEVIHQ